MEHGTLSARRPAAPSQSRRALDWRSSPTSGMRGFVMAEKQDADWNVAEWHGKPLIGRNGEESGQLEGGFVGVGDDEAPIGALQAGLPPPPPEFRPLRRGPVR